MMHGASVTSSDSSVKTEASLLHRAGVTPLNFAHQAASAAAAGLYSDKLGEEELLYNSLGEFRLFSSA